MGFYLKVPMRPPARPQMSPCGTMSTGLEPPTGGADAPLSKPSQMFKSCWSCRLISGGGLILSGAYVFHAARKVMRQGGPTSMGTVAQITFAPSCMERCAES
uniref:Distal membrane-arm assembly complex protein 1-like domain-containing protein n=1 Tax=Pundamilia nyererei TaxID=303518 RepID=A0A3B4EZD7_9CICH